MALGIHAERQNSCDAGAGVAFEPVRETPPAESRARPLPLSGVRVLDLSHVFQGPYATFLMAMAGAEVIKIEPPQGDICRQRSGQSSYPFRALNGCKRGIVLNLKTPRGRALLLELSKSADVVVENFTPSVMPRLGLDPQAFFDVNPRLVYASGSGFGRSGPNTDKLALDLTIQAISGLMTMTGEKGGRPLKAGGPVADFMSGVHLYGAIMTALFERERTGRGRLVEVSMMEALFGPLLPSAGLVYTRNAVPERSGNRHIADSYVPFDAFETSDGWIAIACATNEHWRNLAAAMERPDLADREELRDIRGRVERIAEVTEIVARWAADHTREEISTSCDRHHVPSAPLQEAHEVLADEHLHARGFLTEQMTENGPITLPNSPLRFEGTSLRPLTPAPALGADTDTVLAELCGLDAADLADLREKGVIK